MTPEQIKSRYERNFIDTDYMVRTPTQYGAISFRTLKIYYVEKGFHLDEKSFEANLGLKTPDGKYNLLAELMSDRNTILTHAIYDTVVPIESATLFEDAVRDHGGRIDSYYYNRRNDGHCIWVKGSDPHKLHPDIEERIKQFISSLPLI